MTASGYCPEDQPPSCLMSVQHGQDHHERQWSQRYQPWVQLAHGPARYFPAVVSAQTDSMACVGSHACDEATQWTRESCGSSAFHAQARHRGRGLDVS